MHERPPLMLAREGIILPGQRRVVQVPTPAAGLDWSVTVPGGRQWRIDAARALFATSSGVAPRIPRFLLSDGSTVYWENGPIATLPASATFHFGLTAGGPQATAGTGSVNQHLTLPDLWLPGGHQFQTQTSSIDVADQWSGIALLVSEYWYDDIGLSELRDIRHQQHPDTPEHHHTHPGGY